MTNYVIHAFWKPELQHDSLAPYIVDMLNIPEEFKPNTGTITSLVYSGNIELIQSFRVRNSLLVYLEKVTAISEQIRILLDGMGDGIPQISEVFDPSSYKRQYERNAGILEDSLDSKVAKRLYWRVDFEEVPFPAQLEEIFQNRNVYRGYQGIAVGHRTVERLYRDLIDATDNLQRVLEQEGY